MGVWCDTLELESARFEIFSTLLSVTCVAGSPISQALSIFSPSQIE